MRLGKPLGVVFRFRRGRSALEENPVIIAIALAVSKYDLLRRGDPGIRADAAPSLLTETIRRPTARNARRGAIGNVAVQEIALLVAIWSAPPISYRLMALAPHVSPVSGGPFIFKVLLWTSQLQAPFGNSPHVVREC